jgi:two-component system phosphate regulon response regulator PhoB
MATNPTVLLVEDSEETAVLISRLIDKHCQLNVCKTIRDAKAALGQGRFDLILLDLELPDGGGMGFYAQMKQDDVHCDTPAIFVTGNSTLDQKLQAFGLGADDYITKPFEPSELKARVLAKLAKLKNKSVDGQILKAGNLEVNLSTQRASVAGKEGSELLSISQIEFRLLTLFVRNRDRVFSREQLIDSIWGNTVHVSTRTLDSHISHLRSKLRTSDCVIESVRGIGYRMSNLGA